MGKSAYLTVVLACALGANAAGCGGDDDTGGGTTAGTGGSSTPAGGSGGSGGGGTVKPDPDPINTECPQTDIGPMSGPYAPKGACCYRKSNTARVDDAAATRVLEYRLNYFLLLNHQMTIGQALESTQVQRFDNEEQSLLFRFTLPQKEGKVADGDGKVRIGAGRYNCDGTYSYYNETAAPTVGANMKVDRWAGAEIPAKVTAAKTDKDRVKATFKDGLASRNKESYTPYLGAAPDFAIDWEGESQGFDILEMPSADANIDCVGKRQDMNSWSRGSGKTLAFARVDLNGVDVLDALGVSFCQLMAFGSIPDAPKCDVERCKPGDAGCVWKRLPDSICPTTDADKTKWGCHLGYNDNPDNAPVKTNCSPDLPATIDPDNGTTEGQCCDPLGKNTGGLPACNAWLQINEFVAAAADITDTLADGVQKSCHGK